MKNFFLIFKHAGAKTALIYLYDSIIIFLGKAIYFVTLYKRSIHSSIFDVIKYSKDPNVILNKFNGFYELTFNINKASTKVVLRKRTSDLAVFKEIFIGNEYQKLVEKIFEKNIKIKNIIDVGSNIGLTILYFTRCFPDSIVIGIEPDQTNFSQIEKNVELNQLKNIKLEKAGLWSHQSNLNLSKNFRHGDNWSFSVEENVDQGNIKGITMESLFLKHKFLIIDLLKIDIEGSEQYIFESPETCAFLKKIKVICIEVHHEVNSKPLVVNMLAYYNFEMFFDRDIIFGINQKLKQ